MELEAVATPQDQVRSFDAMAMDVKPDGLVEALIVPWDVEADVMEPHPVTGAPISYRERFIRGSLDDAMRAPGRIGLAFTHSDAFTDRLGYGISLRDSAEGGVAQFQLYRTVMDKAMEMLNTSHRGMSMTFRSLHRPFGPPDRSGVLVDRTKVRLRYVAATDQPVYEDAQVLALRDRARELQLEQDQQQERARRYAEGLALLQDHGRTLTPGQVQFLEQHRGLLVPG